MDKQELQQILEKLASGSCTNEEYGVFTNWAENCSRAEYEAMLISWERIAEAEGNYDSIDPNLVVQIERGLDQIDEQKGAPVIPLYQETDKHRNLWTRIAAAATVLAFLSLGLYQYLHMNTVLKAEYANDIVPGTGKPCLTLANGQKVIIGINKGLIAKQGNVFIQQDTIGQLSYSGNLSITKAPYNTLTNPRGGKMVSLILSDGTIARLDAASSITYQTAFTEKSRNVSITGRVYFEVKHNKKHPFYVSAKDQVTKDLGTRFIIEAYNDDLIIKTTLIDGSLLVNKNGHQVLLKPGQQTIATNSLKVQPADLDEETAWITGDFDFNKQDLHSVMRDLSRVYDIKVTYKDNVENLVLDGMISRSHNISAVLEMIEATGKVHFEINGKEVTVIAGTK